MASGYAHARPVPIERVSEFVAQLKRCLEDEQAGTHPRDRHTAADPGPLLSHEALSCLLKCTVRPPP